MHPLLRALCVAKRHHVPRFAGVAVEMGGSEKMATKWFDALVKLVPPPSL